MWRFVQTTLWACSVHDGVGVGDYDHDQPKRCSGPPAVIELIVSRLILPPIGNLGFRYSMGRAFIERNFS